MDLVGSQGWNLMREGEAEKQVHYSFMHTKIIILLSSYLYLVFLSLAVAKLTSTLLCMQKQYAALVWISRPLEDTDIEAIVSLKELVWLLS